MDGRLDQLDLSAAFYMVSHCGLLYKLMPLDVEGPLLPIVSKFLSDRRQQVRLNGKVSTSVDRVSGVAKGSVLGPLLVVLYISELFYIVRNHIVGYADDSTIYEVILRLLSRPQVIE